MGRNLFVFSDGTGNRGGKTRGTNVWRLYNLIDRHHDEIEQLTFYDDGVGTQDLSLLRVIGGIFGWGLSKNICDCYEWLARNYRDDDRIALFGFSRGAFTVRCVARMIHTCGLLDPAKLHDKGLTPRERRERVRRLLWAYRADDAPTDYCADDAPTDTRPKGGEQFESWLRGERYPKKRPNDERWPCELRQVDVDFVGVWDTVDAVGMPNDDLRRVIDPLGRFFFARRAYGFRDSRLHGVKHARQALAIDDERRTFRPKVWKQKTDARPRDQKGPREPERLMQVWFPGAHSNIGGGYPKEGLAHVTLDWMIGELEDVFGDDIAFTHHARKDVWDAVNLKGRLYDPRTGYGAYYSYDPRDIIELQRYDNPPRIHVSAFRRIFDGSQGYAPLFLPKEAQIAYTKHGGPFSEKETNKGHKVVPPDDELKKGSVKAASSVREELKRLVSIRRRSYWGFVWTSLLPIPTALLTGVLTDIPVADSSIATVFKGFLPDLAYGIVDVAWAHWPIAILAVLIPMVSGACSLYLRRHIREVASTAYDRELPDVKSTGGSP